ncbi:hypothetical protein [Methanolapillus ohkumae]
MSSELSVRQDHATAALFKDIKTLVVPIQEKLFKNSRGYALNFSELFL